MKHKPRGYWTKERCHKIALTCKTRKEFQVKYSSVYQYARKYNWLDEICTHMYYVIKPKGYWTKELCHIESLKFNTRWDFERGCYPAYVAAHKNRWIDDICLHMTRPLSGKPRGYWTKERCHEIALTCKTRKEFAVKYNRPYRNSRINGWLDEICTHMVTNIIPKGYWTKEKCHIEALKYNSKKEFRNNNKKCHDFAYNRGWLNDICSHMITTIKPMGYWNSYEHCEEVAKQCKNIGEFCRRCPGYRVAYRNDWLHKLFPNSIVRKRKNKS